MISDDNDDSDIEYIGYIYDKENALAEEIIGYLLAHNLLLFSMDSDTDIQFVLSCDDVYKKGKWEIEPIYYKDLEIIYNIYLNDGLDGIKAWIRNKRNIKYSKKQRYIDNVTYKGLIIVGIFYLLTMLVFIVYFIFK